MLSTATGTSQNNNKDNYKVTITYLIHNMSSHYSTYLSTLIHVTIKIILLSSYYHSHFTDEDIETWRSNCPKFHSEQKRKVKIQTQAREILEPFVFHSYHAVLHPLYRKYCFRFYFQQGHLQIQGQTK